MLVARRCARLKEMGRAAAGRLVREAGILAGFIVSFFVVFWLLLCVARYATAGHYSSWRAVLDSMAERGVE